MTSSLRTAYIIVPLLATLGCYAAPQKAHMLQPGPTTRLSDLSKQYWDHSIAASLPARGKVVIEEFSVEYVNSTNTLPFDRQPMLLPPPIDPIGLAIVGSIQLSGVGRQSANYTAQAMSEIAGRLYSTFIEQLEARGLTTAGIKNTVAAAPYARLKAQPQANSSPLRFLQTSFSSDAGRIESSATIPAPGLGVVSSVGEGDRQKIDRDLMTALTADAAVSVHLRVVVFRGSAALMQDSSIRIVPRVGKPVTLTSKRSIVSDNAVISGDQWQAVHGKTSAVDGAAFSRELNRLLPIYLNLAFGSTPPHPSTAPAR